MRLSRRTVPLCTYRKVGSHVLRRARSTRRLLGGGGGRRALLDCGRRPGGRRRRPHRGARIGAALLAAAEATVPASHPGLSPPATFPAPVSAGDGASAVEPGRGDAPGAGDICRWLMELLVPVAGGARVALPADGGASSELPEDGASPLDFFGSRRLPVAEGARVRPPRRVRVDADVSAAHPRVRSVLARGLRVRVPASVPAVWRPTRVTALMTRAVPDLVRAGVLAPGRPVACYPLFAVPKTASVARIVYDLSALTPFMPRRPCKLPSIGRALQAAADGYKFAIKIDLRDGYYHIPLAPAAAASDYFGVLFQNRTYVFRKLPMGLCIAANEMQWFACATVKVIERRFPGVIGMAYLDDFLFMARCAADLSGVADFLVSAGFQLNFSKSLLCPVSRLTYFGIDVDLGAACTRVAPDTLRQLRAALSVCFRWRPVLWRQRLAGYINFVRPCLKLPLELVRAVHDGDHDSCLLSLPFIDGSAPLTAADVTSCREVHGRAVFVDATPDCIGIVQQGYLPVSVGLPFALPVYYAEYLAALTAVLSRDMDRTVLYSDNLGVVFNLSKGRCPRAWLPILLSVFKFRSFSVHYVPSHVNPADAASRRFVPFSTAG